MSAVHLLANVVVCMKTAGTFIWRLVCVALAVSALVFAKAVWEDVRDLHTTENIRFSGQFDNGWKPYVPDLNPKPGRLKS